MPSYQGTAAYSATTNSEDGLGTSGIMSFFAFLTRFKTHLYAAFALRTALILYGDYQVCAGLLELGIWAVVLEK